MAHTMFGPVADGTGGTVEDPTRLRRRFTTTRRPSSRHSRWIFLWLTVQPSPQAPWAGAALAVPFGGHPAVFTGLAVPTVAAVVLVALTDTELARAHR